MITQWLATGITQTATGSKVDPYPSPKIARTAVFVCNASGGDVNIYIDDLLAYVIGANDTKLLPIGVKAFTLTGSGSVNLWEVVA
jgi:hypothetical protein